MIIKEVPTSYEVRLSVLEARVIYEALKNSKDLTSDYSSEALTLKAQFEAYLE